MAATEAIQNTVARLAEQLQCELQNYKPTRPSQPRPGPQRYLYPTGLFALGLWQPGDEIHLVCLTDNSPNTFWEYIAEKLDREDLPKFDCTVSSPHDEASIWLHYCRLPPHFDLITVEAYGFPNHPQPVQPPKYIEQNLCRLQDTWHLWHVLGQKLDLFRDVFRTLRSWAESAGVFSNDFGMLDAEALVWMLYNSYSATALNSEQVQCSSSEIVQSFVNNYQTPESLDTIFTPSRRKAYTPLPQIAADSKEVIANAISQLAQEPSLLTSSLAEHYRKFCKSYEILLLVSAECWAHKQCTAFNSQLAKEMTSVIAKLHKSDFIAGPLRIWPRAVKPSDEEWIYVIGVGLSCRTTDASERRTAKDLLTKSINTFSLSVDNSTGRATIDQCQQQKALSLLDFQKSVETTATPTFENTNPSKPPTPKSALISKTPLTKLPPASQVLSRLRWDPLHAPHDYEVGYLDRFEGLKWMPLEKWGREVEEEDFVPEHRIRVFRRLEAGGARKVVWEREGRVCELGG